jgi:hypothetical protein
MLNFGSWSCVYYLEFLAGSVEMELISFLVVLAAMALEVGTDRFSRNVGKRLPFCTELEYINQGEG